MVVEAGDGSGTAGEESSDYYYGRKNNFSEIKGGRDGRKREDRLCRRPVYSLQTSIVYTICLSFRSVEHARVASSVSAAASARTDDGEN